MKHLNGHWTSLRPLPEVRSHSPVIPYKNRLYVFGGGSHQFKSLNTVYIYDIKNDRWETAAPMPTKRSGTAGFLINNQMHIVGGGFKKPDGNFQFLPTLEIYNPETDSWSAGPDMLQPHDYPAAAELDDHIYIFGGHHPEACLGGPRTDPGFVFSERWRPGQKAWEKLADMPTPRFAAAAIVRDGKIDVTGGVAFRPEGFNNFDFSEVYNPQNNKWHRGTDFTLPWTAAGHGLCVANGVVFFFGGYSTDNIHSRAAALAPTTSEWQRLPDMPLPRAAMGVATLDRTIYLVGGWANDGRTPIDSIISYSW